MTDGALRWRMRRGMRELDVLLERYYATQYASATPEARRSFARLLECEDADLWAWVMGRDAVPEEFADVVARIRGHA